MIMITIIIIIISNNISHGDRAKTNSTSTTWTLLESEDSLAKRMSPHIEMKLCAFLHKMLKSSKYDIIGETDEPTWLLIVIKSRKLDVYMVIVPVRYDIWRIQR